MQWTSKKCPKKRHVQSCCFAHETNGFFDVVGVNRCRFGCLSSLFFRLVAYFFPANVRG